jgi:hypothetical protein
MAMAMVIGCGDAAEEDSADVSGSAVVTPLTHASQVEACASELKAKWDAASRLAQPALESLPAAEKATTCVRAANDGVAVDRAALSKYRGTFEASCDAFVGAGDIVGQVMRHTCRYRAELALAHLYDRHGAAGGSDTVDERLLWPGDCLVKYTKASKASASDTTRAAMDLEACSRRWIGELDPTFFAKVADNGGTPDAAKLRALIEADLAVSLDVCTAFTKNADAPRLTRCRANAAGAVHDQVMEAAGF